MSGRTIRRFPVERNAVIDSLVLGERRHMMHGLVEVDVTGRRAAIREAGRSFTAWVVACVARAVAEHPAVHACRDWRGRLVMFDDVDVMCIVEVEVDGRKFPFAHVMREANRRSVDELTEELRRVQGGSVPASGRWLPLWFRVPASIRRLAYRLFLLGPERRRRNVGTVGVTAVGMFASGFAMSAPTVYPLAVLVGGVVTRAGWQDGEAVPRDMLQLTLALDHDLVDGAPAARFGRRLVALLESGALLDPQSTDT